MTLAAGAPLLNWTDIIGHKRVTEVLSRAIERDRLHHAYLFTGPPGVGKRTTAFAMAAVLNCDRRQKHAFAPNCGECSSCHRIDSANHPDVTLVEPPNTVITIDQIRELQKGSRTPYEAPFRIIVIDDAHAMTQEAANALLKTLEEPPPNTILFVVTDQPHRLLDTIISRCQRMRFGAIDQRLVAQALADDFSDDYDKDLLSIAAGYGEGSLGRSLQLLESGMLEGRREFLTDALSIDPRSTVQWLDAADQLSSKKAQLEYRLDVLMVFFRDLLLFKRASDDRMVNRDLLKLIEDQAGRYSVEAILGILDALMAAKYRLNRHVNGQLLSEDILDRLRFPDSRALAPPA